MSKSLSSYLLKAPKIWLTFLKNAHPEGTWFLCSDFMISFRINAFVNSFFRGKLSDCICNYISLTLIIYVLDITFSTEKGWAYRWIEDTTATSGTKRYLNKCTLQEYKYKVKTLKDTVFVVNTFNAMGILSIGPI